MDKCDKLGIGSVRVSNYWKMCDWDWQDLVTLGDPFASDLEGRTLRTTFERPNILCSSFLHVPSKIL